MIGNIDQGHDLDGIAEQTFANGGKGGRGHEKVWVFPGSRGSRGGGQRSTSKYAICAYIRILLGNI